MLAILVDLPALEGNAALPWILMSGTHGLCMKLASHDVLRVPVVDRQSKSRKDGVNYP